MSGWETSHDIDAWRMARLACGVLISDYLTPALMNTIWLCIEVSTQIIQNLTNAGTCTLPDVEPLFPEIFNVMDTSENQTRTQPIGKA